MMSLSRGALTTAVWLTLVYAAETHCDASRSATVAVAYSARGLGGLAASNWVASPNSISNVILLVTLVCVSVGWAAHALPMEMSRVPLDYHERMRSRPPVASTPVQVPQPAVGEVSPLLAQ